METKTEAKGRVGVTTDPWRRKGEWLHKYPKLSNWQDEGTFANQKEARQWEKKQRGYDNSNGGDDPGNPNATRYGYRFDY